VIPVFIIIAAITALTTRERVLSKIASRTVICFLALFGIQLLLSMAGMNVPKRFPRTTTPALTDSADPDGRYIYRLGNAFLMSGDTIYSIGGMEPTTSALIPEGGEYIISERRWHEMPPLPTPRALMATAADDDFIYVIGGRAEDSVLTTAERWSIESREWQTLAPMPTARWGAMTCIAGRLLYVIGGIAGVGEQRTSLRVVEILDLDTGEWRSAAALPEPRHGGAVTEIDRHIYVLGGQTASAAEATGTQRISNGVLVFRPEDDSWSFTTPMPTARSNAKALVSQGKIFVVGGAATPSVFPTLIHVFDPQTLSWSDGPHLIAGRAGHGAAVRDGIIFAFGDALPWLEEVPAGTQELDPTPPLLPNAS
jgi:hypothetical protein